MKTVIAVAALILSAGVMVPAQALERPNPDYARDLNSSEIWAQKKGRSSLI